MFATYTWSHAIDDAPEQNNIDSPNFLLSDPTNRRRDRGNSLTDRRHAFNGNLVYTPAWHGGNRALRYLVNGNRFASASTNSASMHLPLMSFRPAPVGALRMSATHWRRQLAARIASSVRWPAPASREYGLRCRSSCESARSLCKVLVLVRSLSLGPAGRGQCSRLVDQFPQLCLHFA